MILKLEPPTTHHLNAAQGWLELGNAEEAIAELEKIPDEFLLHPEVLQMCWQAFAKARRWVKCIHAANELIKELPDSPTGWIHRSYALHELRRTREALDALMPAVALFPKEWLVHYNVACYLCQLGQADASLRFLQQAFKLGDEKEVRQLAMTDVDLKELRERIARC